ncbi:hypothetical protein [Thermophilibacter provencensis]|uniref:hypothetical protein n=1 Tax=Thermophilibacter provencensis TaxID=1852386 RepID=UPI0029427EF5|nr:hypothetical protein [Thermophilibacter provencensis]
MARRRRTDDFEDDGRVIADMSAVERPSLLGHAPARGRERAEAPGERTRGRREPEVRLTTSERVWMALGALKAGLTVGCVYVVVLGLAIVVLLSLWSCMQG